MNQRYQPGGTPPNSSRSGFWKSLPGILTGFAAVIASIGGLVGALFAAGVIGGSDDPTPVANVGAAPTATVAAQENNPVVDLATATTAPAPPTVVTAAPEIPIDGFWVSQGGFSWQVFQSGDDVEVASLDFLGTSYLGTRDGNFIRINQVANEFGVFPSSGSMEIRLSGDVIDVVIDGTPDVMLRQ